MARRGLSFPQAKTSLERYQSDPVAFAREQLRFHPWERQAAIMQAVATHKRVAVRSCNNSGKTACASVLAHWFVRCFEPALVLTTAPTQRQVKEQLWKEIASLHRQANLPGTLTTVDLAVSPSQKALGLTTNTPERFQGWHEKNILIIVDEASGVEESIYQAIEGCLTTENAKLLLIGNPNNASGSFFEAFRSDLYDAHHIEAADVPVEILPADWAAERCLEWGPDSPLYQVRVLGNFPDQGEDSLIRMSWAQLAQERELERAMESGVEAGVDVARYGGDETVCYLRREGCVLQSDGWRGNDLMATSGRIASLAREHGAQTIKVDDIGVGGGVTDSLQHTFRGTGVTVTGVNVGEAAFDTEKFANRRAELYWGLRERFREGDISIPADDSLLLDQLTQIRFSYTPRGQIKIESKDEMKKRRPAGTKWQSPDRADALMLAFAVQRTGFVPWVGGTEGADMYRNWGA